MPSKPVNYMGSVLVCTSRHTPSKRPEIESLRIQHGCPEAHTYIRRIFWQILGTFLRASAFACCKIWHSLIAIERNAKFHWWSRMVSPGNGGGITGSTFLHTIIAINDGAFLLYIWIKRPLIIPKDTFYTLRTKRQTPLTAITFTYGQLVLRDMNVRCSQRAARINMLYLKLKSSLHWNAEGAFLRKLHQSRRELLPKRLDVYKKYMSRKLRAFVVPTSSWGSIGINKAFFLLFFRRRPLLLSNLSWTWVTGGV